MACAAHTSNIRVHVRYPYRSFPFFVSLPWGKSLPCKTTSHAKDNCRILNNVQSVLNSYPLPAVNILYRELILKICALHLPCRSTHYRTSVGRSADLNRYHHVGHLHWGSYFHIQAFQTRLAAGKDHMDSCLFSGTYSCVQTWSALFVVTAVWH